MSSCTSSTSNMTSLLVVKEVPWSPRMFCCQWEPADVPASSTGNLEDWGWGKGQRWHCRHLLYHWPLQLARLNKDLHGQTIGTWMDIGNLPTSIHVDTVHWAKQVGKRSVLAVFALLSKKVLIFSWICCGFNFRWGGGRLSLQGFYLPYNEKRFIRTERVNRRCSRFLHTRLSQTVPQRPSCATLRVPSSQLCPPACHVWRLVIFLSFG